MNTLEKTKNSVDVQGEAALEVQLSTTDFTNVINEKPTEKTKSAGGSLYQ